MNIYVVLMHRFGNNEMHTYVLGTYDSLAQAQFSANVEEYWRGGKYSATIYHDTLNKRLDEEKLEYYHTCC